MLKWPVQELGLSHKYKRNQARLKVVKFQDAFDKPRSWSDWNFILKIKVIKGKVNARFIGSFLLANGNRIIFNTLKNLQRNQWNIKGK